MKLIFEVDINPDDNIYISKNDVKEYYDGDWYSAFSNLIESESIGLFDGEVKFIGVLYGK